MSTLKIPESLDKEFKRYNIKVSREYTGICSPCFFFCACGNEFLTKPRNVQRGRCTKCLKCEYKEYVQKLAKFGIDLLITQDEYVGKNEWYDFKCHCQKIWKTKLPFIIKQTINYPSCGCSSRTNLGVKGKRCNKLLAISNLPFRLQGNCKYIRCICDCGNMANARLDRFLNGKLYGCKQCAIDNAKIPAIETNIGDKFGKLQITSDRFLKRYNKGQVNYFWVKCHCKCGKACEKKLTDLARGQYLSCKACADKERQAGVINKLNQKLESYLNDHGCQIILSTNKVDGVVKYQCSCGLIIKRDRRLLLAKMRIADRDLCKCKQIINSKRTSNPALELHSRVGGGFHNFDTNCGNVDIALRYENKKVAIEYDEWWWHHKSKKRDLKKTKELLKAGWFVLRVRASKSAVPSKKKIAWALDALIKNKTHLLILTHKTWRGYIDV